MQIKRTRLFIGLAFVALSLVLIIQVNWMMKTARMKEDLFNEKSGIVLARTSEALHANKVAEQHLETGNLLVERSRIDSLLLHFMDYYNFHVKYTFKIVYHNPMVSSIHPNAGSPATEVACYNASLDEMADSTNWQLRLVTDKQSFLVSEMGVPFIASCLLVVMVFVLFWRSVKSLQEEKKISEHTTDFLNNMTHEFKTPLTNIALATKMIVKESGNKQEDKIKEYSGIILDENEKLRLQVEQVLSMTALEKGEVPIQKTELDMHLIIQTAVSYMQMQLNHANAHLILDLKATQVVVMGDRTHLINVFVNLMDNALKYANGAPELCIKTSAKEHVLIIEMQDNGIGIDKKYHKQLFEKYFRVPTKDVHDAKGFGLGLAYVHKIVELHHGRIFVQSKKGEGTTFIIEFPNA